ncbi:hypothetical protein MTO96_003954 [Rhipicephalus appendiculatus]
MITAVIAPKKPLSALHLYHRWRDCSCSHPRNIFLIQKSRHQAFCSQYIRGQRMVSHLVAEDSKNSRDCVHRTRKLKKTTPLSVSQMFRRRGHNLSGEEEEGAVHRTDVGPPTNCCDSAWPSR